MNTVRIGALAEEYAQKFNPERVAPFPYENILKECVDLEIFFISLVDENVSGATLYKDEKFSILVNADKHENRQHFTLAHELGHYFLHQEILKQEGGFIDEEKQLDGSKILYRLDDATRDQVETEANHFAASLIMPRELTKDAWETTGTIEECARIFKVSTIAMSLRLAELNLVQ
jgi:Zn-dependent peptidase ImmA (M78 family)